MNILFVRYITCEPASSKPSKEAFLYDRFMLVMVVLSDVRLGAIKVNCR